MAAVSETNEKDPVSTIVTALKDAVRTLTRTLKREEQELADELDAVEGNQAPQQFQQQTPNQQNSQEIPTGDQP